MNALFKLEEGPEINAIAKQVLEIAAQKRADVLIFLPRGDHYLTKIQNGGRTQEYRFTICNPQKMISVVHTLEKLVDIRPSYCPVVRQGKFKRKLAGIEWSLEIVSIPDQPTIHEGGSFFLPTMAIFFTERFDQTQ